MRFDAYCFIRRARDVLIHGSPEVQTKRMIVDPFALWRMKLHHAVLIIPEEFFDHAHLIPIRRANRSRNGYMLPAHAVRSDAEQRVRSAVSQRGDDECTVITTASVRTQFARLDAQRFWNVKAHVQHRSTFTLSGRLARVCRVGNSPSGSSGSPNIAPYPRSRNHAPLAWRNSGAISVQE